jgi:5-methylcytosine-specific restriction endonuclease McrA
VNPKYAIVASLAEHVCEYCQAPEALSNMAFEVDHIIPTSRCGTEKPDNLAFLLQKVCDRLTEIHVLPLCSLERS